MVDLQRERRERKGEIVHLLVCSPNGHIRQGHNGQGCIKLQ